MAILTAALAVAQPTPTSMRPAQPSPAAPRYPAPQVAEQWPLAPASSLPAAGAQTQPMGPPPLLAVPVDGYPRGTAPPTIKPWVPPAPPALPPIAVAPAMANLPRVPQIPQAAAPATSSPVAASPATSTPAAAAPRQALAPQPSAHQRLAQQPPAPPAQSATALGPPAPLAAESVGEATPELRAELRQAIDRLMAAEQELKSTRQALEDRTAPTINPDHSRRISDLETAWDRFEDQLESESEASYPTAKMTGFTQLDDYLMSQEPLNKETVGNGQNGLGFRRARVSVVGNVAAFTAYMVEVDFATAGRPSFFDVWVEQDNLPFLGSIRAGQYCQPFSIDAMSGFRHLPFLERSLPFLAFVPFRRVGAMASNNSIDERTYWAYSVFRTGGFRNAPLGDSRFATDIGDQGGVSFSGRITQLLQYDEPSGGRYLSHIGASYNVSKMTGNSASGSRPFYQARTTPEFGPIGDGLDTLPATFGPVSYAAADFTPPAFVDTGRYVASSFNLLGAEAIYQAGPLSLQSEFMATEVNSIAGPIWYTGAYGQAMYRLTGEHRGYDKRYAAFKNPMPFSDFNPLGRKGVCGWGAWELSARLSYVSLRNPDRLAPSDYIANTNNTGNGILTDTTLGMTWFLNYHTKVQFNWIHSMLDNDLKGYSTADSFVSRVQVDF